MTSTFIRLTLAALMTVATMAGAAAQGVSSNVTAAGPRGVPGSSEQQSIKGMNPAPTVTLGGTPVIVNTPVLSPNNADSTYSTYQGQPASGPSAMLAATAQGSH